MLPENDKLLESLELESGRQDSHINDFEGGINNPMFKMQVKESMVATPGKK